MIWHDAVTRVVLLSALLSASCAAPDLGTCDPTALGGSKATGMLTPHAGQQLLQDSCAAGLCHSSSARGAQRAGAPAGLDFNVVPASTAESDMAAMRRSRVVVEENADSIWEQVETGSMPPPAPAGSGPLSKSNKEIVRNWLACGSPIVESPARANPDADEWTAVFTELGGQCLGCHSPGTAGNLGGSFVFGESKDACGAYKNVVSTAANTAPSGPCAGKLLVKAGDPDNSVLLQKLEGGPNLCGGLMPQGRSTPYAEMATDTVMKLRTWIASGAPAPPGCN
jgi:hypothetical protein